MTKQGETEWPIKVTVTRVSIDAGSTIGTGYGTDADGRAVVFVGDHRPMREMGEAIATAAPDEPVIADVYGHNILAWSGVTGAWDSER